jgi:hypothetical protein
MRILQITAVALGVCGFATAAPRAEAVDARVESACSADYFAHCGQHDPEGRAVRRCMRTHGAKLSPACVDALVAAGEVSKAEVARRSRK